MALHAFGKIVQILTQNIEWIFLYEKEDLLNWGTLECPPVISYYGVETLW